jgi:hypothetical protein
MIILDEAYNLSDIISKLHSFEITEKGIENNISEEIRLGLIDLAKKIGQQRILYNSFPIFMNNCNS